MLDKWLINGYYRANSLFKRAVMIVKTRIFGLCNGQYRNLSELAQALGISVSQIYRGRQINQKFIVGAIKAFPNHKLDDLFYLVPELPNVNNNQQNPAIPFTNKLTTNQKQLVRSAR